jgi:hypothetical protein
MGMTARFWLAVALTTVGLQWGCGESGTGPDGTDHTSVDADDDGHDATTDCNDRDASVWRAVRGYEDADRDGHGFGSIRSACVGKDTGGWADSADDCAPQDASRWRLASNVYPDQDGDGATATGPVTVCVGDTLQGYREQPGTPDCDDQDPTATREQQAWLDRDGDGVGGATFVTWCPSAGRSPPPGTVPTTGDCAPDDSQRSGMRPYAYRDADGDGFTVPSSGEVCTGASLPPGYSNQPQGLDCDDQDTARFTVATVWVDSDRDGYGEGESLRRCSGHGTEPGYAFEGNDCAPSDAWRWQWRSYASRDADGDSAYALETGVVCSGLQLPSGYSEWSWDGDCDDRNPSVYRSWSVFADADGDRVGAGAATNVCGAAQVPAGYSTVATDCAPEDRSLWQTLAWQYRDTDGDGYGVSSSGTLCAGASLPAGYGTTPGRGADCDDTSAAVYQSVSAYVDTDADGVGAGEATALCTNGTVPAPWVASHTDCAADDASRWQSLTYKHADLDGDGYTAPTTAGSVCSGATLPAPYFATAVGNDCDDTDDGLFRWAVLYPDHDGDGVGAPPRQVLCIGTSVPGGMSIFGDDANDNDPGQHVDDEEDELVELLLDL